MAIDPQNLDCVRLPVAPQTFALPHEDLHDLLKSSPFEARILVEQCMDDAPFALSLLEEFVEILPDRRDQMKQAADERNLPQLMVLAHALKGAAGYAAAIPLSRKCANLEHAAATGDLTLGVPLLHEVVAEIERCVQEFPNVRCKLAQP